MSSANWKGLAKKWLAASGVLALPACSTLDLEHPTFLPPPRVARLAMPVTAEMPEPPAVIQTAAEEPAEPKQEQAEPERLPLSAPKQASLPVVPPAETQGKPLPIDLPTALTLTNANPLDIRIATERLRAARAAFDRAKVMWLPNIGVGLEYFRHDGQIQDVAGFVFNTSKSSFFFGAGPTAVVQLSEAFYAPLAAKQIVRARQADVQATRNDTALAVAEAYFTVQQARGEVAGSIESLRRAEELVKLTQKVAPDLAPTVEVNRAKAELSRRRQAVEAAYERWQVASADLTRILRLEPGTLVEPTEEPSLVVELLEPTASPDDLIPVALTHRPELAADQAIIQAALARVRQEKMRPFVPTVAFRGGGAQVAGLAGGVFGGGRNDNLGNFAGRFSFDLQAIWEVQSFGLGNRALQHEREAEQRQALLQLIRTQERVMAEVVQAHARAQRAANRLKAAADGVADAAETAEKNLRGLVPGKLVGNQLTLVFRPQEAVAAVAALDQAYRDYYAAVADHNRAQFQLYRALGQPAQLLMNPPATPPALPPPRATPPAVLPMSVMPAPRTPSEPQPAPVSVFPPRPVGTAGLPPINRN